MKKKRCLNKKLSGASDQGLHFFWRFAYFLLKPRLTLASKPRLLSRRQKIVQKSLKDVSKNLSKIDAQDHRFGIPKASPPPPPSNSLAAEGSVTHQPSPHRTLKQAQGVTNVKGATSMTTRPGSGLETEPSGRPRALSVVCCIISFGYSK